TVKGWAFSCEGAITAYEVWIDNQARPIAVGSLDARPTVAQKYRKECPLLPDTIGFSFVIDPAALNLTVGSHIVKVYVSDLYQQTQITNEITFNVTSNINAPTLSSIAPVAVIQASVLLPFTLAGDGLKAVTQVLIVDPLGISRTAAPSATSRSSASFSFVPDYPGLWLIRA